MAECEKLSACPFFNDKMVSKPGIATIYKKHYCFGDNKECARSQELGKEKVPVDLFPNDMERAQKIIASGS